MDVIFDAGVLNANAQAEDKLCTGIQALANVFVGGTEVIVGRIFGIGVEIGEDRIIVHFSGMGPVDVVKTNQRKTGVPECTGLINQASEAQGAAIDAVKELDALATGIRCRQRNMIHKFHPKKLKL